MGQQLELFQNSLPHKPYCSDDLLYGIKILPKSDAILKKYIQPNQPALFGFLTQDCDYPNALEYCLESNGPPPNFSVINKKNGRSHLFWGLNAPVCRTELAHRKPLEYLACIQYALREKVKGDRGYTGLIAKNPLSDHWLVVEARRDFYDLGELADYLEVPTKLPSHAKVLGLGRNCTLFDSGRKWAYKQVLKYRLTGDREDFYEAVRCALEDMNDFPDPLPNSEVKQIAKSISKWTWDKYTKQWTDREFSAIQSHRAKQGKGVARYRHTPETRAEAVLMLSSGVPVAEVAAKFSVGVSTLYRWQKDHIVQCNDSANVQPQ